MSQGYIPIENFQTKLYQRENCSKRFLNLTEDRLAEIAKKIYRRKEALTAGSVNAYRRCDRLDNYIETIRYLSNTNIHADFPEYDERIAYLIMTVDPELEHFKEFLKLDMPSISKIQSEPNPANKQELINIRKVAIAELERNVREKLGFFDAKLLKFEELFFRRFYGSRELIVDVGQDKNDDFSILLLLTSSFDSIDEIKYSDLVRKANLWTTLVKSDAHRSKIAMYSVLKQKDLLGLRSHEEQVMFYILAVDPNLDMLRIYEEESMIQNAKARIVEQFGYFSLALIKFEKQFYNKFCPDKEVSIWLKK